MILKAQRQTVGDKTLISGLRWYVSDRYGLLITTGGVGGDFSQTGHLKYIAPNILQSSHVHTVHDTPLSVNLSVLDIRVFNGRVVVLNEHLLKELNRQCRLADSPVTDYNHLVGRHILVWWLLRHGGAITKPRPTVQLFVTIRTAFC